MPGRLCLEGCSFLPGCIWPEEFLQLPMWDAVVQEPFLEGFGYGSRFLVVSQYPGIAVTVGHVVLHMVLVQGAVKQLPVNIVLPLDNLHDLSGAVFQLFGEHHHRVGLHHDLHEDGVVHGVPALCQGHHPAVGALAGVGVDGGADRVAGAGAFRRRQALRCGAHLPHAYDVRVLAQHTLQKEVLVDVHGRVLVGAGEQVYYRVQNIPVFVPLYKVEFPAALLYGDEAAVVGDV